MAQYTDTTLGDILLKVYSKGNVTQLQNLTAPLFSRIGMGRNYTIGGDSFNFGVNVEGDEQYGFIPEDGALPEPDTEEVQQLFLNPLVFVAPIKFTGLARAISQRNEHAFVSAIQYAADQKLLRATAYREGCCFRTGTGRLSLVNVAVAGATTVNVDSGNVMWFRPGMKIDVFNASDVRQSDIGGDTVAEVDFVGDANGPLIEMEDNVTYDDNAAIYPSVLGQTTLAGTVKETYGLDYFIKTSGDTLGKDVDTYPTLKGNVVDASTADVTEDLLLAAENRVLVVGGIPMSSIKGFALVWHPNQRRKYFRLVQAQKQYLNLTLDAGYRSLRWNDHEAVETYNCPETSIYQGDLQEFQHFVAPDGEMQLDTTFGPVIKWQQGFDAGVMYYRCYDNYALRKPNAMVRLEDLGNVATR